MRGRFGDEQVALPHRRRPRPRAHDARRRGRRHRRPRRRDEAGAGVRVQPVRGGAHERARRPARGRRRDRRAACDKVVALSTDKAVNPVNLYGATKLCAEKIFVQGNAYAAQSPDRVSRACATATSSARGARSCRVFREQLDATGRLTITDERMTRFWITLAAGGRPRALRAREHGRRRGLHPEDPVDAGDRPRRGDGARRAARDHRHPPRREAARAAAHRRREPATRSTPATCTWSSPSTRGGTTTARWLDGKPLDDGFVYSSDTNDGGSTPTSCARPDAAVIPYGRQYDRRRRHRRGRRRAARRLADAGPDVERVRGRRSRDGRRRRYAVAFANGTAALHAAPCRGRARPGRHRGRRRRSRSSPAPTAPCYVGATAGVRRHRSRDAQPRPRRSAATLRRAGRRALRRPAGRPGAVSPTGRRVVIEDAAHALGATHARRARSATAPAPTCACFSFHPVKAITTGEGGAVTTNSTALAERLRRFRTPRHRARARAGRLVLRDRRARLQLPAHRHPGRARRTSQLAKLERFVERRNELADALPQPLLADAPLDARRPRPPHGLAPRLPPVPVCAFPDRRRRLRRPARAGASACRCTTCRSTATRCSVSPPTSASRLPRDRGRLRGAALASPVPDLTDEEQDEVIAVVLDVA